MDDDYQKRLDQLVEQFLSGSLAFSEFQRAYSACYIDEVADRDFTPDEIDYYGNIHEKGEWTAERPTPEERGFGWLDIRSFREWLDDHQKNKPRIG